MTATIVFDFDGTIAVGDGPVLAYARQVARRAGAGYLSRVRQAITAFDRGETSGYRDGYDIVASLGIAAGLDTPALEAAYLASRDALGTPDAPVDAAPGLTALLDRLPRRTRVVLATNAPELGIRRVLDGWGLGRRFDALFFSVGKPVGLTAIVRNALTLGPVLSIGDIIENDLAPAAALGAATALVGSTAQTSAAKVTMRAPALAALSDDIVAWATAALPAPSASALSSPSES